jgi:seryl-tRNA synthetase
MIEKQMHDIRKIRENPENFDKTLLRRFYKPSADNILKLDSERRLKISEAEQAQAKKKYYF